jgi:hypothetical protein
MKRTLVSVELIEDMPILPSERYGLGTCIVCKGRFFVAETMWALSFEWFKGEPDENGEVDGDGADMPLCPDCAKKPQAELTAFAVEFFNASVRRKTQ